MKAAPYTRLLSCAAVLTYLDPTGRLDDKGLDHMYQTGCSGSRRGMCDSRILDKQAPRHLGRWDKHQNPGPGCAIGRMCTVSPANRGEYGTPARLGKEVGR